MSRARQTALAFLALLAFAALPGCSNDPANPDPVIEPRATAQGLLDLFSDSTADSDSTFLAESLHEDFRFYFTPQDRSEDPTLPEFWTRNEFLAAVGNMMAGAVTISMNLIIADTLSQGPCTAEPDAPVCTTFEVEVVLNVEVPEEPENRTYTVDGLADISVVEESPGSGMYLIHTAVDRTAQMRTGGGATQPATWSGVLARYR